MKPFNYILLIFLLAGCVDPVTQISVIKPTAYELPSNKTVSFNQSNEITWNNLLSMFANSDFQIDSINMNGHQVKMRLSGQPDAYIDCGIRKFNTEGNTVTIVNARRNYKFTAWRHNHLDTHTVSNGFTGYVNIFVTGNNYSSKVFAQFDLELHTQEQITTTQGSRHHSDRQYTLKLNPNQGAYSDIFGTTCQSTGSFERQVMELITQLPVTSSISPVGHKNDSWSSPQ